MCLIQKRNYEFYPTVHRCPKNRNGNPDLVQKPLLPPTNFLQLVSPLCSGWLPRLGRIYVQMEWTDSENTSFFGHVRQPAAATFRSQPKTWIRNLLIKIPFCSEIVTELFSSFQQFKAEIIEQKNKTIEFILLLLEDWNQTNYKT